MRLGAPVRANTPLAERQVGRPGWRHYLALDGQRAVAIGALFVDGEAGWLGGGATLPAYRGLGAQGALIARRILDAAELGCRWVVTETGYDTAERPNASYRNMRRAGLELAYLRPSYIFDPDGDPTHPGSVAGSKGAA